MPADPSWTRPADVRTWLRRQWERGALLAGAHDVFPLRVPLQRPSSRDLVDRFAEARAWMAELSQMPHVRLVCKRVQHRVLGANDMPSELWVDTREDAIRLLDRRKEAATYAEMVRQADEREPGVRAWLERRPLRALEMADAWPRLLDILGWLRTHPRSGIYLRQVDLPGVHTKFIETYRTVLAELVATVLPDALDAAATSFEGRHGFLERPQRVRFRILDPRHSLLPGGSIQDVTLDEATFAAHSPAVGAVFVTENEVNFLAFPPIPDSMVVFGAGYGFDALQRARWLQDRQLYYWGDIDTHGFAILDQFRSRFPAARSLLMDAATFQAFSACWSQEATPRRGDLPRLTEEERALYEDLCDNRFGHHLRLEQERIGFDWVRRAISQAVADHRVGTADDRVQEHLEKPEAKPHNSPVTGRGGAGEGC